VYVARHDADLAFVGSDDTWAVGTDETCVSALEVTLGLDHVTDGNPLRDGDHQLQPGGDRLHDCVGGKRWRDIDHRGVGPGGGDGFTHSGEDRQIHRVGVVPPRDPGVIRRTFEVEV
jgi:hypothetical protein